MRIKKTQYNKEDKIVIDTTGPQGNAFYILGIARKLGEDIYDRERTDEIMDEMKSSDYENLLLLFENYFGDFVILLE